MRLPTFATSLLSRRAAAAVLALAAAAGVVVGRERPTLELAEPPPRRPQAAAPAAAPAIDLARLARAESSLPHGDPFAQRAFQSPPRAAAAPARPAAPPPLPFQYMGKVIENGKLEVYVTRGEEFLSLEHGMRIDGQYRVDKVTDTQITFTYLPLKVRQTLDLPPPSR